MRAWHCGDGSGRAYVTGTNSADFPTTSGAFDRTFNGATDAFVTKLNASGSALAYSTFLGGPKIDMAMASRWTKGRAYVTGTTRSADYPTTQAPSTAPSTATSDAFVTKLPTG